MYYYNNSLWAFLILRNKEQSFLMSVLTLLPEPNSTMSVSYTHLDVYKRQVFNICLPHKVFNLWWLQVDLGQCTNHCVSSVQNVRQWHFCLGCGSQRTAFEQLMYKWHVYLGVVSYWHLESLARWTCKMKVKFFIPWCVIRISLVLYV